MRSPEGRTVFSSPQAWLSWPWVRPVARDSWAPDRFSSFFSKLEKSPGWDKLENDE